MRGLEIFYKEVKAVSKCLKPVQPLELAGLELHKYVKERIGFRFLKLISNRA